MNDRNVLTGIIYGVCLSVILMLTMGFAFKAGANSVVDSCTNYGKYVLNDGDRKLLCSMISVEAIEMQHSQAEFYTKENKQAHAKDRK